MRAWTRLTVGFILAAAMAAPALAEYSIDEELQFASGLINFKPAFKDFAQTVVDSVRERDPSVGDRLKVIQAELFIQERKYPQAEQLMNELGISNPKAQAIMLTLALAYYNAGESDKSIALYDGFFNQYQDGKRPTDPDVLRFYQTAAYQYGQIREAMGDFALAADCYKRVQESAGDNPDMEREMMLKQAQAWVKAAESTDDGGKRNEYLDKCDAVCHDILWGGLDVVFVNAVVVMANSQIVRGNPDAARDTLNDYMENIRQVDDMLEEYGMPIHESPLGGARSLLGRLYKQEADAVASDASKAVPLYSKALGEYYNVFVKYGKGPYGANAGIESKAIKDILENQYGKTVKIELPDNLQAQAAGTEFAMADQLFKRKSFEEARDEYLRVLANFPESGELSVGALANLAQCYINLSDPLYAKAVATYTAERFGRRSSLAPRAILAAAQLYRAGDAANGREPDKALSDDFFHIYLDYCPTDDRVPEILAYLGGLAAQEGDEAKASGYFNRIISDYPKSKQYPQALSRQAWGAYANHDYADAVNGLRLFLKDTDGQASALRANAMFALADCLRRTSEANEKTIVDSTAKAKELALQAKQAQASDDEAIRAQAAELMTAAREEAAKVGTARTAAAENFTESVKQFQALINGLKTDPKAYASKPEDVAKNATLLEQASYWMAFTLSQKSDEKFQRAAIAQLTKFGEEYPKSSMNAKALKLKGSLQLALKDPAANATFESLATKFPDTDEGKNAQYARISGALDLKLFDQAREAAQAMVNGAGAYTVDQFSRVGETLLANSLWNEAEAAYRQVAAKLDSVPVERRRAFEERALYGIGKASYELKKYDDSQKSLESLMEKYPKSAFFYRAKYVLAQSALANNDIEAATKALNDILRYSTDNEAINDASLVLAEVQKKEGKNVEALSTYKRLEYLSSLNMKSDRERDQIREALLAAIALEESISDDTSLIETVDRYQELFPMDARIQEFAGKRSRAKLRLEEAAAGAPADEPAPAE